MSRVRTSSEEFWGITSQLTSYFAAIILAVKLHDQVLDLAFFLSHYLLCIIARRHLDYWTTLISTVTSRITTLIFIARMFHYELGWIAVVWQVADNMIRMFESHTTIE